VELIAAGPAAAVNELVEVCRRGPPSARVTALDQAPAAADEVAPGFDERR
jgi:acylphosphatase